MDDENKWPRWAQALWNRIIDLNKRLGEPLETEDDIVYLNDDFLVIRDKFPKSTIHWLVLPRRVMIEEISLVNDTCLPLLEKMEQLEPILQQKLTEETKTENISYRMGFHAIPSMKLLHLHFISDDLNGSHMKTPSHWISFTTDFFIPLKTLISRLKAGNFVLDEEHYKSLKKADMSCPKCGQLWKQSKAAVSIVQQHFQICEATAKW